MKIEISKNGMTLGQLVKFVGLGYMVGVGIIFAIPMAIAILVMPFVDSSSTFSESFMHLAFLPIVIVMQALMFSLVIGFGHWIYKKFKSIEIEFKGEPS